MKVNAIGVLPKYQRVGLVAGLLAETYRYAHTRFTAGETNFVWDQNQDSTLLNRRVTDRALRHYAVYEIDI